MAGDWLYRYSNWVMVANWLEQLGHGSRLVRASWQWLPIG